MANTEPMLLVAFWLSLVLATTADQCQLDQLITVASQQPNASTISVNLPAGICYATRPITISNQAAASVTGVSREGSQVGLGFLQNALSMGTTGSRLDVSSLSLVDTSMGPGFMQLPMAVSYMTLTDVDIFTDCWTLLQQQQLPQAKGMPGQGQGYLYIENYTSPGLTAQRVNVSCNLTQTVAQGVSNGSTVLVADSSLSLYNALVASSHMPGAPSAILIVADISVSRSTFRQPVSLVRTTQFIGQPFLAPTGASNGANNSTGLVNPMLDWHGYQQLVLINVKDVGVTFVNLDLMNTPPLTGVYYPRSGMAGAFTIPLWTFWYDPFSSSRATMPILMENVTLVVPTAEYRWMLALAAAVISPLPDVTDAVATVKSFFVKLEVDQSSPRGILAFSRYWGLGINATALRLANIPSPRITFPRLTDSSLVPTFSADVTKSPTLITSINVYTAEDLVTGLAGLQAPSPLVDPTVNVILWRNISLAEVVGQWPQGGFTLPTNITITGNNPTWYNPPMAMPSLTVLDVAKLPHFVNIQPNKTSGVPNTLTFAWHTLLNLSMTIPDGISSGNSTSFDSLCATNPNPWMVLGLDGIGIERVNGPAQYQGSTIIFQDATVVVPTYDLKLTTMLVRTSCVFGNATGGQDGSSMSSFDVLHTNSLYGARISITNLTPPGIPNVYPEQPLLGSAPPPANVSIDSGSSKLSVGAVVGIVVGLGVGLIAIGAAAALLFVHFRQKRRAKQHLETGNQPTAHKSQEGSDSTTMAVSQGRIHNNAQASARDQQPLKDKSGLEQAPKGASGAIRVEGTPLDKLTDGSLHTSEAREAMAIAAATAAVTPSQHASPTPAAELQQVMAALANDIKDSHLTLLDAVGQGGFGTVYKGRWKGLLVAVKTLTFQDRTVAGGKSQHVALMEAAISSSLAHPYVVTTYSFDIKPLKVDHPDSVPGLKIVSGQVTDWKLFIVQEYCDAGSLRQAVLRRRMWDKKADQPDILSVIECALELASGLAHLHQHNIIHGDLNPNNVLLKNDPNSRRGVVCKLCDFGLSVKMGDGQSHISNMRRGTPFYAAPEVMSKGNMTKAADCYSFGVMMWELYHSTTCYRALPDRSFQQRDEYPRFFGGCPREYSSLAEACTSERVASRPPMATVVERLQALLARVSGAYAEPRDL